MEDKEKRLNSTCIPCKSGTNGPQKIIKIINNKKLKSLYKGDAILKIILDLGFITLLRSITMFCETNNILQNILFVQTRCEKYFCEVLSVPHNIVMDLNNVVMRK